MTTELAACVLEGLLLLDEELSLDPEAPWSVGTPDQGAGVAWRALVARRATHATLQPGTGGGLVQLRPLCVAACSMHRRAGEQPPSGGV